MQRVMETRGESAAAALELCVRVSVEAEANEEAK